MGELRKPQFAEEGLTVWVESYELSKTSRWCERFINFIEKLFVTKFLNHGFGRHCTRCSLQRNICTGN